MTSRKTADIYDTVCHVADPDTVVVQGQRFVRERTCKMENAGEVPQNVLEIETVWFCSECGSPIYNDMTPSYCIYCGARVVEVV